MGSVKGRMSSFLSVSHYKQDNFLLIGMKRHIFTSLAFRDKSEWRLCRCRGSGLAVGMRKQAPRFSFFSFQLTIYVAARRPWHQNLDYTNGWRWVVTNTSTQRGGSPDKKRGAGDRGDESWRRRQTASLVLAVVHHRPGEIITWHAFCIFPVQRESHFSVYWYCAWCVGGGGGFPA